MPQISTQEFERLPLRVHDFLAGVPLHDVWAVDLPRIRSGITLDEFLRAAGALPLTPSPVVRALLNIRLFVGRLLDWDREPDATVKETFARRLTTADLSKSLAPAGTREGLFRMVYRFENEQLLELINRTAHAAALSALIETANAYRFYFGVYVRSVGPLDARLHGPDRPDPQVDRLSVAPAQRSHDLGPNLRHNVSEQLMSASRPAVQELYTNALDRYSSFITAFQSPQGLRAVLRRSPLLRAGLRVLDAGCGFGMATFALLEALRERNLDYRSIDAFDLTPAMLARFQRTLEARSIFGVQLREADVLALETLPPSWADYDLILSTSMLEYLPKRDFPRALAALRRRLAPGGHILLMITRRTPETRILIQWLWQAERYSRRELLWGLAEAGFRDPAFRRFPWRYFWLNRGSFVVEARG